MPSTSTWSKHIPALLQKQDGYCYYCGENLLVGKHKENTRKSQYASIDHVIPRSAKGKNHHTNLVVSCCLCNSTKGSIPVDQFVNLLDLDDVDLLGGHLRQQDGLHLIKLEVGIGVQREHFHDVVGPPRQSRVVIIPDADNRLAQAVHRVDDLAEVVADVRKLLAKGFRDKIILPLGNRQQ